MKKIGILILFFVFFSANAQAYKVVYIRRVRLIDTTQLVAKYPVKTGTMAMESLIAERQHRDTVFSQTELKNIGYKMTALRISIVANKHWMIKKFAMNQTSMLGTLQGINGYFVSDKKKSRMYKISYDQTIKGAYTYQGDTINHQKSSIKVSRIEKDGRIYRVFFKKNGGTEFGIALIDPALPSYVNPRPLPKKIEALGGVRRIVTYKDHTNKILVKYLESIEKTDLKPYKKLFTKIAQYNKAHF